MAERPSGTVTFLATDIEQSTRRWEEQPDEMRLALAQHDRLMTDAIELHAGWLFKHTGDGVMAAFAAPRAALEAAIEAQRRLELPVRMGICTGEAELRNGDYFGPVLNRTVRTMAAGHGGQVLVAASTAAIVTGFDLADLGQHQLRDLTQPQRLFQLRAEGLKPTFPALKTLSATLGNLPAQTTNLLGRDEHLGEIAALLRDARLVTLTGVGGVGKTRLAIRVATEASSHYPDGVWMVELAAVGHAGATAHAVAGVLSIAQQPGKTIEQSISAGLAGRRLLLVLDNCEHLIDAVAALAQDILTQCPQIRLLATSREALAIGGERIWPVPSLGFRDGAASPAVKLFVERARSVTPDFALGDDSDAACEICRRLDGIPLAIELAAARTRAMSTSQIRDRLDERFRLLTGGSRRALERHQTLRHAVQWSYDLLNPAEKAVLARASTFAGSFTLDAAEFVCVGPGASDDDILDVLDSLVRKSLVTVDRSADKLRYGLLETIRQFAEEQLSDLGEGNPTRLRHSQYFAAGAEANFATWLSPHQLAAYQWLDSEIDNLRSAFRWASDHDEIDVAVRIASNIGDMARFRIRDEASNWAAEIIDAARRIDHRRLGYLLTWAGSSAWGRGNLAAAKPYAEEAISLAGSVGFDSWVWAYVDLAAIAAFENSPDRAIEFARAGAAHPDDRSDRFCLSMLLYFLATGGASDEAMQIADEVVDAARSTGIPSTLVEALMGKASAFAEADLDLASEVLEQAIALARKSGNQYWEMAMVPGLAAMQARRGDPLAAARGLLQILESWSLSPDLNFVTSGLGALILLFDRLEYPVPAATLNGALRGMVKSTSFFAKLPEAIDRVHRALDNATFEEANRRGAAMTHREIVSYASDHINQAIAAMEASRT